jgi:hypothetical protein
MGVSAAAPPLVVDLPDLSSPRRSKTLTTFQVSDLWLGQCGWPVSCGLTG